jgi:hypothetical protein
MRHFKDYLAENSLGLGNPMSDIHQYLTGFYNRFALIPLEEVEKLKPKIEELIKLLQDRVNQRY